MVLIHGHPFDRTLWEPQLSALRGTFRVVAPDLRGFGGSPVTPGRVLMREYAADIEELLAALGIARAAVVGLSMGGLVAMELAAAAPGRYWALGLVATTAEPPSPQDLRIRDERADATERDGMSVLVDYMHTGLYGPACPPAVRARVDAMMAAAPPAGAAAALRGRGRRPDYRPLLAALDIPALVVAGTADPWSNAAVTAEIAASLKRPELVVIDGAGHLPNLEAEAQFNEALLAFLAGRPEPGTAPGAEAVGLRPGQLRALSSRETARGLPRPGQAASRPARPRRGRTRHPARGGLHRPVRLAPPGVPRPAVPG